MSPMPVFTTHIAVRERDGMPVAVQFGAGETHPHSYAVTDPRDRWRCLASVHSRRSQDRADQLATMVLLRKWPSLARLCHHTVKWLVV
jgi:hypothetical protein